MKLAAGRGEELEISLTPLIDVVFTLIIFFVVTTTFDERSAVQLDLPKASPDAVSVPKETLTIAVDAQGRYFVGENEVLRRDAAALRQAISEVIGDDREQPVVLRADANTPHQSVVTALDVLGQLGFAKISIATVGAGEDAAP